MWKVVVFCHLASSGSRSVIGRLGLVLALHVVEQRCSSIGDTKQTFQIEKGSRLVAFWDLLHSDPAIFENPEEFQYDRFVNMKDSVYTYKSGKKLPHSPVMSFGGGSHLCPGRKFIAYEVRLFMAMLMLNFDIRLMSPSSYVRPKIDQAQQGLGIAKPDSDPKVQIRPIFKK